MPSSDDMMLYYSYNPKDSCKRLKTRASKATNECTHYVYLFDATANRNDRIVNGLDVGSSHLASPQSPYLLPMPWALRSFGKIIR